MDTIVSVGVLVFLAVILLFCFAVLVPLIVDLRRTVLTLRKTTEERLDPALEELTICLKTVRSITESADAVAADMKYVSGAIADLGQKVVAVGTAIESVSNAYAGRAMGLRAGIGAAVTYFVTHLVRKGER